MVALALRRAGMQLMGMLVTEENDITARRRSGTADIVGTCHQTLGAVKIVLYPFIQLSNKSSFRSQIYPRDSNSKSTPHSTNNHQNEG